MKNFFGPLLSDFAFTKCRFLKKRQQITKIAFSILVLDIYFAHVSTGKTQIPKNEAP